MRLFKKLYFTDLFFQIAGVIALLFAVSFFVPPLFALAQALLMVGIAVVVVDIFLVFSPQAELECERQTPKILSLNDENDIKLRLQSNYSLPLRLTVIDELPIQFQRRDFELKLRLAPFEERVLPYSLTPKTRGEYVFQAINIFIKSTIGLVEKRQTVEQTETLPVYPSIIQMKKFELKTLSRTATLQGVKRLRRLGHSYEFEQIKDYVRGDDYRSVNWKATGRQGKLMVNQYEDERSQQIYVFIDKSRVMKMPFQGLSLLDYAINSSLVIANIALKKYDKAGLLTFSDKIGTVVKADRSTLQLNKILHALYKEAERPLEANYDLLYQAARQVVTGRSLIFLYTNFESLTAAERVLPILRRINNLHLLVVVFFENTEVTDFLERDAEDIEGIYQQTIARKFMNEKRQIVQKLRQYGIQAILTAPDALSINSINKYLELKSRGLI
jgi:uncharacterized protein (DUF58 family)